MGVIQLAVPMVLYMRGAKYVPAVQMVLITMADTVLNPLWVWLVHREVPATSAEHNRRCRLSRSCGIHSRAASIKTIE